MYYNEAYAERQKEEKALLKKWERALNANGGIKDEHLARTTAIVLENYLEYLHENPQLIAEDQMQTGAFTGVNLALLGLIARVIPNLIGAELVGMQAMPTPRSPIFTMRWYKDMNKGKTAAGDEMWDPELNGLPGELGVDPYYSSSWVQEDTKTVDFNAGAGAVLVDVLTIANDNTSNIQARRPYIFKDSMIVTGYNGDGVAIAQCQILSSDLYVTSVTADASVVSTGVYAANAADAPFATPSVDGISYNVDGGTGKRTIGYTDNTLGAPASDGLALKDVVSIDVKYEYKQENEANIPEISFKITEANIDLQRRQLRGKYTLDAAYDIKKLHGINLDSELANMMKIELQGEINREIISDLRLLANVTKTIDFTTGLSGVITTQGNYDDAMKYLLDAINVMAAQIWNVGRMGTANFVVGNPVTLAFLDRVPGFVGSGVTYNGKDLSFAGSLGGKIKFYNDPNYPKKELLVGYKGPGALDAGYIHCPYLPITATPTMVNQETGDPAKIFYTRYGKTYGYDKEGSTLTNKILNGENQYGRLTISGFPTPLTF